MSLNPETGEMRSPVGAKRIEKERRLAARIAHRFVNLGCFDPWNAPEGADWYDKARADIRAEFGKDADAFADILAATSPQCDVGHNVKLARDEWERRRLGLPVEAWIPCHAANLRNLREGKPLRGPKVRAFAAALRGDDYAIVVDTWMLRASGVSERRRFSSSVFRATHEAIRLVSQMTPFHPVQCQAMIWFQYRRENWIAHKAAGDGYFPIRTSAVPIPAA